MVVVAVVVRRVAQELESTAEEGNVQCSLHTIHNKNKVSYHFRFLVIVIIV
jgi:hypothetical protein